MRWPFLVHLGMPNPGLSLATLVFGSSLLWLSHFLIASNAHAASPITPSGLDTQLSAPLPVTGGETLYNITGGTRAGTNLFHSFGEFNVLTNNIANFLNDSGQTTTNILGRVTGGNPSNIFGTIQTTGFGDANLFLMNPSGIVFGSTASLNVGGSVTFTTADYLRLTDNVRFNAIPNATTDALLSTAPVAAYGYLGSNPGAITIQGSQFKMSEGDSISLIGGDITIQSDTLKSTVQSAHLTTPGGQINLVSVASSGEILAGTLEQASNINGRTLGALGTIQVLGKSVIDASGNGGGTVRIRSGQFVLDNSKISTNVTGPGKLSNGVESVGGGIDIIADQDAMIQNLAVLETNVTGNTTPGVTYGGVHLEADHIGILGTISFEDISAGVDPDPFPFTGIRSNVLTGSTSGNSGTIMLKGNSILVKDSGQLQTITNGIGNAGSIIMRAIQNLDSNAGLIASKADNFATGDAGGIELTSTRGNISLTNETNVTSQTVTSPGTVGNITLNAPGGNILLADSALSTLISPPINLRGVPAVRTGGSGEIRITTNNLQLNGSGIAITNLSNLPPGSLTINLSGNLSLRPSSVVQTPTRSSIEAISRGPADSAGLTIIAHDVLISDGSSLTTETLDSGAAGPLTISAVNLHLTNGGQIKSGSRQGIDPNTGLPVPFLPSGSGGTVTIQGRAGPTGSILIDGQQTVVRTGKQTVIHSGIFSNAEGTGAAGNIVVNAKSVTLQNGGKISAETTGTKSTAIGGSIDINATDHMTLTNNASITASSTGPADAGSITISGNNLTIASGGRVEASTSGTGKGGSIAIATTGDVTVTGLSADGQVRSGIFAKTLSGGGGNGSGSGGGGGGSGGGGEAPKPGSAGDITITAKNLLLDGGAQIDSSTTSGGTGGKVSITTAENITIAGSSTRLTSDATRGNGKGGSLTLIAKNITVRDNASVTAATGGKGNAGDISLTALDQLLLQSAGTVTTSTSGSGKGGTIIIQANQVLLDGQGTRISADTLPLFADMIITINILHPNVGDLVVRLDSPTGTRVALLSRVGGNGTNFIGTQFNDRAPTQITSGSSPFTGTFTPREPLGQLNNELVAGNWALNVQDQTPGNQGSLESWTLQIGEQTFQSTGEPIRIPDNGSERSIITVANPTVPTVPGVGEAPGIGGNIVLTAGQSVTVSNGASVSANSTGSGNAGNILINAGQQFEMRDSSITAQATKASGGNIDIKAVDLIRVANGSISSSVQGGPSTAGGNITIDPKTVVLQNAQIRANADQGNGGNIQITTPLFLKDSTSSIDASSRFGLSGTVTIQSPTSNLSGTVGQLASKTNPPQVLLQNRCIALAGGEQSTFILAGRDALPFEPGGWLSSPVAMEHWTGEKPEDHVSRLMVRSRGLNTQPLLVMSKDQTTVLSLRRLTPPGFLVRSFAASAPTGCSS